jgi:hypothetical protein
LEKLKIAYIQGKGEWDKKEVKKDLGRLLKEYDRLCQKKREKLDIKMKEKFY